MENLSWEDVRYEHKTWLFTDDQKPLTIKAVRKIAKDPSGMREYLVLEGGEEVTVELRALRAQSIKREPIEDLNQALPGVPVIPEAPQV